MRLVDTILSLLFERPMSAPELAARARLAGHDVTDVDVRCELAPLFGRRVTHDGGAWRLLDTASSTLAALATSTCAVVAGLRAQRLAGEAQ
jgi:hypothetical protein